MSRVIQPTAWTFAILLVPLVAGCGASSNASSRGSAGSEAAGSEAVGSGDAGANVGGSNVSSGGSSAAGGNQSTHAGGACSFSMAPPAVADVDPMASSEAQANAAGLRTLDFLIGRYLRGDVPVYSGTAKAHDNASALANVEVYGPRPDGVIAEGPALALLQVRPALDRDWDPQRPNPTGTTATLVVHGLPPDKHFILRQHSSEPGLTEVSLLSPVLTTASMTTSCSDCAPDLLTNPAKLAFTDLAATGQVTVLMGYAGNGGHEVDVTAGVTASVDLSLLPPCGLTFDDLVVLDGSTGPNEIDGTLQGFKKSGHEMTYMTGGSFTVGGTAMCPLNQPYMIQLFVDLDDLSHYGTRNFVAGTPAVACVPQTP